MKAILRISLLMVMFLGLFPISCYLGNCDDPVPYQLDLNDLSLSYFVDGKKWDPDKTVESNQEFQLGVRLVGEEIYVMSTAPQTPIFTQPLMAIKDCPPDYYDGKIIEIDSFNLYCDTLFLGHAAGASLNPYFEVQYDAQLNWPDPPIAVSFSAFNDSIRSNPNLLGGPYREMFSTKAYSFIQPGNYRFTINMHLKNGTLISKETDLIHFE